MDITPEISEDGIITLKINPSISDTLDAVERDSTGSRNIPQTYLESRFHL